MHPLCEEVSFSEARYVPREQKLAPDTSGQNDQGRLSESKLAPSWFCPYVKLYSF